jgi:hypothetical protein
MAFPLVLICPLLGIIKDKIYHECKDEAENVIPLLVNFGNCGAPVMWRF